MAFFSLISPNVYDDISLSEGTIYDLGWHNFHLKSFLRIGWNYYQMIGRPGLGFIHFWPHFPLISAVVKTMVFLCIYLFIPFILVKNRLPTQRQDYRLLMYAGAILAGLSLIFPYHMILPNDIYNGTILTNYLINAAVTPLFAIVFWYFFMQNKTQFLEGFNRPWWLILAFGLGFLCYIVNEFWNAYGTMLVMGIPLLALIKNRRLPSWKSLPPLIKTLGFSILLGNLVVFTAPGFRNRFIAPEKTWLLQNSSFTETWDLIVRELGVVSVPLILINIVLFITLQWRKKSHPLPQDFLWKSAYLVLVYLSIVLLSLLARFPYFRTAQLGVIVLPLIYLMVYQSWTLLGSGLKSWAALLSLCVMVYFLGIVGHNIRCMWAVQLQWKDQIEAAKQHPDQALLVHEYRAPYWHVFYKKHGIFIKTSEQGHAYTGSTEEMQLMGGRLFMQVPSIKFLSLKEYWLSYYNYTSSLEPIAGTVIYLDKLPSYTAIIKTRLNQIFARNVVKK